MAKLIELTIDSLTYGGRGVGRHNGKAVFVPGVLPGEVVNCRIVRDKKRYSEAEFLEVLDPSPDRRVPPCKYFPECGGCQWQHIPYSQQLYWKERIFSDVLVRATRCDASIIQPIIAAPEEFEYRCRAQIKFRMTARGLIAGFYRTGSHRIVDTNHCQVLDPLIPPVLARLRERLPAISQADKIHQADFCVDSFSRISIVLHCSGVDIVALRSALVSFNDAMSIYFKSDRCHELAVFQEGHAQATVPEGDQQLKLGFPPGGFTQINLQQNVRLVQEVIAGAALTGKESVLDLYSGVGNFSLPLSRKCAEVVGVEEYAPAVEAAIANAGLNKLTNIRFIEGRSERIIEKLVKTTRFDTVVLDPPRNGAAQVMKALLQMRPERIVYVSCDPTTMARDVTTLLSDGYKLLSARPIDMFPQTWHIESVVVLIREVSKGSL